jgi:quinol monooxygenase YgiN
MITIFGTLHLNPARRDEAVREFKQLVAETSREAGCDAYVVSADLVDTNTLYIFEEWTDAAALEAHRRSEHFAAHQARNAGLLDGAEVAQYEASSAQRRSAGA